MSQGNSANEAKQLRDLITSQNSKLDHISIDLDHLSANLDTLELSQQLIKLSSDGTSSGVATMIARIGNGTGGHKSIIVGDNSGANVDLKCDANGVLAVSPTSVAKTNTANTLNLVASTYTYSASYEITGTEVGVSLKSITHAPMETRLQQSHNGTDWFLRDNSDMVSMSANPQALSEYSYSQTFSWKAKYLRILFDNGGAVAFDIDIVIHQ